ncbi:hypothetical protein PG984_003409 [Apiospora sp. TS-2023a]
MSSVPPPPYTASSAQASTYELIEDAEIVNDAELRDLNEICLPKWRHRIRKRHLHGRRVACPERPEYATVMGLPPNPRWQAVLAHLRDGLRHYGIPLRDIRTTRWRFMSVIATILDTGEL